MDANIEEKEKKNREESGREEKGLDEEKGREEKDKEEKEKDDTELNFRFEAYTRYVQHVHYVLYILYVPYVQYVQTSILTLYCLLICSSYLALFVAVSFFSTTSFTIAFMFSFSISSTPPPFVFSFPPYIISLFLLLTLLSSLISSHPSSPSPSFLSSLTFTSPLFHSFLFPLSLSSSFSRRYAEFCLRQSGIFTTSATFADSAEKEMLISSSKRLE
jgi:hypothetical protein